MKIRKTKNDVDDGTMSMKFGVIIEKFNIFDAMKHPMKEHFVFHIDLLYELVDDTYSEFSTDFQSLYDFDDTYSCDSCTDTNLCSVYAEIDTSLKVDIFSTNEVVDEIVYAAEALDIQVARNTPSIGQPPFLEPGSLPKYLNYSSKLEFK